MMTSFDLVGCECRHASLEASIGWEGLLRGVMGRLVLASENWTLIATLME